ncbi:MAG: hypothetical protein Q9163_005641 [Psora crenata]
MVLASIWFFFWAKNGGFHFRKGDWEDYKSTVLRRKGPNGTTLSGATKTTWLGGGSVAAHEGADGDGGGVGGGAENEKGGKWKRGAQAMKVKGMKRGKKNNEDADVRAYRHEKPAQVGGLNRKADGMAGDSDFTTSTSAYTETVYSDDIGSLGGLGAQTRVGAGGFVPINTPRANKKSKKKEEVRTAGEKVTNGTKRWTKLNNTNNPPPPPATTSTYSFYTHPTASNASTDTSHRPLRPNAAGPGSSSAESSPNNTTNSRSPRKHSVPKYPSGPANSTGSGSYYYNQYTEPLDFESRYTGGTSELGTENSRGTKSYFHPIPGLSGGERKGDAGRSGGGFRRGRGGRRDSLSDSEGETILS